MSNSAENAPLLQASVASGQANQASGVSSSSSYARLLKTLAPYRLRLLAALAMALASAGAVAFYAYVAGPLFRSLVQGTPIRFGGVELQSQDLAWKLPLLLLTVAGLKALSQWLYTGWMQGLAQQVLKDLRVMFYGRLLGLPARVLESRHSADLLTRFTSDIAQVEFAVTTALGSYLKDGAVVLALLLECWLLDWRLFLLAFIVLPVAGVPVSRFAKSVKKVTQRSQGSLAALTQLASEHVQNLPVVQVYDGLPRAMAKFGEEEARYFTAMKRSLFLRGAFTPVLELLGIAGIAAVIGFGASWVKADPSLAQKLPSFLTAALLLYQPLKALTGTWGQTLQGLACAERLFEMTDYPPERDEGETASPLERHLELQSVSFSYDSQRPALENVTLTLKQGQTVALVGPSGGGKSTLMSLLLRFTDPTQGRVLWDGQDVQSLSRQSVRAQLAWVPQEPVIFSGSVRENLQVGKAEASDDALWAALEQAHAAQFVRAMDGGLDASLGEGGRNLSGGQRQRLAIARAFVKAPSVLLLDEPTSALDFASEEGVQAGLRALMACRTVLTIAHRLSTVRNADWIYVLAQGRLIEEGKHADLMQQQGLYAKLVQSGEFNDR